MAAINFEVYRYIDSFLTKVKLTCYSVRREKVVATVPTKHIVIIKYSQSDGVAEIDLGSPETRAIVLSSIPRYAHTYNTCIQYVRTYFHTHTYTHKFDCDLYCYC